MNNNDSDKITYSSEFINSGKRPDVNRFTKTKRVNLINKEDKLKEYFDKFYCDQITGIPLWVHENNIKTASIVKSKENNMEKMKSNKKIIKDICSYCNKQFNKNYLKYQHVCDEKNLSENPNLKKLENICPICSCSFKRSYYPKHYSKCLREGMWCQACEKKIPLNNLERHNKKFHSKKFRKKRKGKICWMRDRCQFCPKQIRLRNKYNHLLRCYGFKIYLVNPKIFNRRTDYRHLDYNKSNYKRNWQKNKWVKIPFKVIKKLQSPECYEIGCSYDFQGNKIIDFNEQQEMILPWIPEMKKPKNKRELIYNFLTRKTKRIKENTRESIFNKIKLEVELELQRRKFDLDLGQQINLKNSNRDHIIKSSRKDYKECLNAIKCYEILIKLKENIQKLSFEIKKFNLLPSRIQEKNIQDKIYFEKEISKMEHIKKIFDETEDFQMKLREAENMELETCYNTDEDVGDLVY